MNNKSIIVIAVVFFLTVLAALLYVNRQEDENLMAGVTPTPSPANEVSPLPTVTDDTWQVFESESLGIRMEYPENVNQETREGQVVFVKAGPSQTANTEFYDGISLTFRRGALETGQTLRELAESTLEDLREMQSAEGENEIETFILAGRTGYRYTVETLGKHTYMYLPVGDGEYLEVIDSTTDPTSQGFEATVDRMLSTVEFT